MSGKVLVVLKRALRRAWEGINRTWEDLNGVRALFEVLQTGSETQLSLKSAKLSLRSCQLLLKPYHMPLKPYQLPHELYWSSSLQNNKFRTNIRVRDGFNSSWKGLRGWWQLEVFQRKLGLKSN